VRLSVLDARAVWHGPLIGAATARGWDARRIFDASDAEAGGYGFIRPHAVPHVLLEHQAIDAELRGSLTMVQDRAQVAAYENKTEQWRRWGHLMPDTWLVTDRNAIPDCDFPIVSKANEGASSVNIRILRDRAALDQHADSVFGAGVAVNCCADGASTVQRGYLLLQRYIPHDITFRVNAVGRRLVGFERRNYPDRPVAQTGNVSPMMVPDESLLDYARMVAATISSKWVALDILRDGAGWKLLETSLAWPWPSPGACAQAPFFGTRRTWSELWDVLIDELEAGVWGG